MSRRHHIRALRRRRNHLRDIQIPKCRTSTHLAYMLAECNALTWVLDQLDPDGDIAEAPS